MAYSFPFPKELEDLLSSVSGKKIGVALSGGIDSGVTALLLKNAGAKVKGYVMKHLDKNEDIDNAKDVAKQLNISLSIIDLRKEFKKVIDYFIDEYVRGRTPNPCVMCNLWIKFGVLKNKVLEENQFYATGHYVRKVKIGDRWTIARAIDIAKDQSYALSMLSNEQLENVIFPLGHLTKEVVKQTAEQEGLMIKQKNESVDLCFTDDRIKFLRDHTIPSKGVIRDTSGKVVGEHNGLQFYAIGQRRKLNITKRNTHPYYVKQLIKDRNEVIVGKHDDLYATTFIVEGMNWLLPYRENVEVIVRNKMKPQKCKIKLLEENRVKVVMKDAVWAPAPGQLAVFYDNNLVVGGGWIV